MKLCLGTVQFGLNYGIQGNGKPRKETVFEMLNYAIENGVEMLDTASAYGEAEMVLGEYFREHPEMDKKVAVVSKLKPDAFTDVEEECWANIAIQNARESAERVGVKSFSAYLFHNATHIFNERAVQALYKVKETGLADHVGVSIYTPEEAMKALEYSEIEAIQIPYNVFDHRLDKCGFFDKAQNQGVMVFARSSLLQGLAMMNPEQLPDRVIFAKEYLKNFQSICNQNNLRPLHAAVGYVGNKAGIDYIVFGVDNIEQLKEYVSMKDEHLSNEMIASIDNAFESVEERLVNPVLWK